MGFDFLIFFFAGAESWLEEVEVLGLVADGGAGGEEDFGGGGEGFLFFFFLFFFFFGILRVSFIPSLSFILTSVNAKGAPLASTVSVASMVSSASTILVELVVQLSSSSRQSTYILLGVQEHLPSSSCKVQAPCCRPERVLPWGVSSSSQSLTAERTSGNSSFPVLHIGAVCAATAFTMEVNLLATRE